MKRGALLAHPVVQLAGSLLRRVVPKTLWHRYSDWRYSHLGRHSWLERDDKADGHVAIYWNSLDHPNRTQLIELLAGLLEGSSAVLEFGCHAGMNFKRLQDRFGDRLAYFGVEPNHDACEFLRQQLPFVTLLEAADEGFLAKELPPVDVSFVNVVLYSVHGARARLVLERMCRMSEVVVLGEQLSNTSSTSRFESDPEMYAHPYAAWLRNFEFGDQQIVPAIEAGPQHSGFLIARRSTPSSRRSG